MVVAGARDCVRSGTIGTVRVLGLRELSPNPFSSGPGFPFCPLRGFATGEHIFFGVWLGVWGGGLQPQKCTQEGFLKKI